MHFFGQYSKYLGWKNLLSPFAKWIRVLSMNFRTLNPIYVLKFCTTCFSAPCLFLYMLMKIHLFLGHTVCFSLKSWLVWWVLKYTSSHARVVTVVYNSLSQGFVYSEMMTDQSFLFFNRTVTSPPGSAPDLFQFVKKGLCQNSIEAWNFIKFVKERTDKMSLLKTNEDKHTW